jgi:hypothetical protein
MNRSINGVMHSILPHNTQALHERVSATRQTEKNGNYTALKSQLVT